MNRNAFRVPTSQPGSRMPQYNQQQLPATPGADVSARLSDSAGQIMAQGTEQQAKGLETLGRGMQQAAKAGYDLYHDYQTTQAKEAWLTYKQEATTKRAELGRMQGKDAIDPEKGITAQMAAWRTERRQALMKDLGGPAASMFDTAAKDIDSSMDAWAIDKVNTERLNYENKTSEAHISLLQDEAMAVAANPSAFGEKMGALEGELKAIAGRSGLDETWTKAKFQEIQQKTLTQTISDSIAGEQLGKANAMIKAYGPMLGGHADSLRARADAKGRELQARARADAERIRTEAAISSVQDILSSTAGLPVEDRRASVFEQIGKVQDIRTRMSMFHMAEGELAFQKTKMDSAINAQAMDIVQQTKEMGPLERNQFFVDNKTPEAVIDATQRLMSRDKTPPVIMSEAKSMYDDGKSVDEISSALGKSFSPDGWSEFKNYTQSKELQKANRKATAFFNEMALKSGLKFDGSNANEEDKLYYAEIKARYDDMVANNEFKSRSDQEAWIYNALAKRTKPGLIFDSHYTPREAQGETGLILPMPPHERAEITRELVAQARPVTEENIQKMYNEKLQERGW